ncbi:hypothetical protein [Jannaschia rubra]|uniref:hypothetical protein n=1 Tax=Jannaschia rubra TaxID=282197 RepID=UPI00248FC6B4|nr:hypothetical protein [Jannaschia rubra]
MKFSFTTAATIAALTFGGVAIAQSTSEMGQGYDMLQTALATDFEQMGIPTDTLDNLTLGQIAAIKAVVESEDGDSQKRGQIEAIIANN